MCTHNTRIGIFEPDVPALVQKGRKMIREILGSDFMDCEKVKEICRSKGFRKSEISKAKASEGIKTLCLAGPKGKRMCLWFVPERIWEKYGG